MKRRDLMRWGAGAALLSVAAMAVGPAVAQVPEGYPSRAMSYIVPYPPGGIADIRSRIVSEWLSRRLGETIVVENVPGAAGIIGAQRVSSAPADGYTFFSSTSSAAVVVPQLTPVDYEQLDLLVPVANFVGAPVYIFVANDSPYQTLEDILEDARARPGQVTYGTSGANSVFHLTGEVLNTYYDVELVHVPYTGAPAYILDMVAGRLDFGIGTLGSMTGGGDQVRGIITASSQRSDLQPDVPTGVESGYPELLMPDGAGIFMHIDTPWEIVEYISDLIGEMVEEPDVQEQFLRVGHEINYIPASEFRGVLESQYEMITQVIEAAGLSGD